ncbi:MAG: glycine zipper 2TM domain-containing protein [Chitinophagaceae bacterium]|nr:glycine zipper 2TM domain-containing protein [Chitinophagaceae bacterium]
MKKFVYALLFCLSLVLLSYAGFSQTRHYVQHKKWSHRKKGAVVGGVGGAVVGAAVSHNHVKGAVIGGAAGAGAGYLLGRHKDKKVSNY